MMHIFSVLLSALVPIAHAQQGLQNVGASNPGVAAMWQMICQTLPFCGLGAQTAPVYFSTKIIAVIQSFVTTVAIMVILYASIKLSMTQMDESGIEEAKKIIMYAAIGIILSVVGGTLLQYLLTTVFPQLFNG